MRNFVVIVGIDGSGKSTLIEGLKKHDSQLVFSSWKKFSQVLDMTYDQENLPYINFIKELSPITRSALFIYLVGLQYDKIINPCMTKDETVIVDSYWYKLVGKMAIVNDAKNFLYKVIKDFPSPNKVIFIDTPPEVAFSRKTDINYYECGGNKRNFVEFQHKLRLKLLEYSNCTENRLIIDGRLTKSEILNKSYSFIKK